MAETMLSCDLHVHSLHSGPASLPFLGRLVRECYSEPEAVYEAARSRGMTLFTLTDHDSIDGLQRLRSRGDVFVSEELTLELGEGRQLHLGVYGIDERQHQLLQSRRRDPDAVFAFLAEERVAVAVNHLFSALTGPREPEDFTRALERISLIETRNAMMPAATNEWARQAARTSGARSVGGSDAHTVASVARAFTVVPGARTREEYLEGLRRGCTIPMGRSGSYARLTTELARIAALCFIDGARAVCQARCTASHFVAMLAALPVLPLLPVVTSALWSRELRFGRRHFRAFERCRRARQRRRPAALPLGAAPLPRPALT